MYLIWSTLLFCRYKKCTKMHDARADLLIKLFYDVLVTSLAAFCLNLIFLVQYGILAFAKFKRPDCTRLHLRVLKFSKFSGGACPRTPLVSRDFVAPNGRSRAHIANILNYATPGLTNKKRLGTPLIGDPH